MSLHISAGTPKDLAVKALAARLFNPDGGMRLLLGAVASGDHVGATVSVLSDETQHLHGVCLITADRQVSVFVRPEVRGKGWGQKLVQMAEIVRPNRSEPIYALPSEHVPKGVRFWEKCRVELRDHGIDPTMHRTEWEEWKAEGQVLLSRRHNHVDPHALEALYIQQLYGDEYSEHHNGIRGQLACVFDEGYAPFEHILFHYSDRYDSCALVSERRAHPEGDTVNIVELQLYVRESCRNQGLGQQIINEVRLLYPGRTLFGYHTDTSRRLLERNGIIDLRRVP